MSVGDFLAKLIALGVPRVPRDATYAAPAALLPPRRKDTFVFFGDSIIEYAFETGGGSGTYTDNGDGTTTLSNASGLGIIAGDTLTFRGSTRARDNQNEATILSVSGAGPYLYTYANTGSSYSERVASGAGQGYVLYPLRSAARSIWDWAQVHSGCRGTLLGNLAAAGSTWAAIVADVPRVIALKPAYAVFNGGMNAWYSSDSSLNTVAVMQAAVRSICQQLVAAGIVPIYIGTPPRGHLDANWSTAARERHHQGNRWAARYLPAMGGHYIDPMAATVGSETFLDHSSTYADYTAGWTYTDYIHPTGPRGQYGLGKALGTLMQSLVPASFVLPLANALTDDVAAGSASAYNIHPNPALTGTGGTLGSHTGDTFVGTLPDDLSITTSGASGCTVTFSQVARTVAADGDAFGNWLRLAITNATAATQIDLNLVVSSSNVKNAISAGDVLTAACRVRTSSGSSPGSGTPTALSNLQLAASAYTTSGWRINRIFNSEDSGSFGEAFSGILALKDRPVRSGDGNPSLYVMTLTILFNGAGNATIDVAHPTVWRNLGSA